MYLEISEAYSKTEYRHKALPLLESLLMTSQFNVAAVWLLYSEILSACSRLEDAANAYKQVSVFSMTITSQIKFTTSEMMGRCRISMTAKAGKIV